MPPKPVCFFVMPYGTKTTGMTDGKTPASLDFDALWAQAFEPAVSGLGYTAVRADQDIGALIVVEMLERLVLADLVIADVTLANANVYYEVGVRHVAKSTGCVLVNARWSKPTFDLAQNRRLQYEIAGHRHYRGRSAGDQDDARRKRAEAAKGQEPGARAPRLSRAAPRARRVIRPRGPRLRQLPGGGLGGADGAGGRARRPRAGAADEARQLAGVAADARRRRARQPRPRSRALDRTVYLHRRSRRRGAEPAARPGAGPGSPRPMPASPPKPSRRCSSSMPPSARTTSATASSAGGSSGCGAMPRTRTTSGAT